MQLLNRFIVWYCRFVVLVAAVCIAEQSYAQIERVELAPQAWRAVPRTYIITGNSLFIVDLWDDKPDTLYKGHADIENEMVQKPIWTSVYLNNPCGADDGDDLVITIHRKNLPARSIRLYESYQADVYNLCQYINSLLPERSDLKITYAFLEHKKSKENCPPRKFD